MQPTLIQHTYFKVLYWDMHGLISDIQMYWDGLGDVVLTTTPVRPIAYAEKDCKY